MSKLLRPLQFVPVWLVLTAFALVVAPYAAFCGTREFLKPRRKEQLPPPAEAPRASTAPAQAAPEGATPAASRPPIVTDPSSPVDFTWQPEEYRKLVTLHLWLGRSRLALGELWLTYEVPRC